MNEIYVGDIAWWKPTWNIQGLEPGTYYQVRITGTGSDYCVCKLHGRQYTDSRDAFTSVQRNEAGDILAPTAAPEVAGNSAEEIALSAEVIKLTTDVEETDIVEVFVLGGNSAVCNMRFEFDAPAGMFQLRDVVDVIVRKGKQ